MMKHKSVIASWTYDSRGCCLDCYLEIQTAQDASCVRAIQMRSRIQGAHGDVGLFRVPTNWGRSQMEEVIPTLKKEELQEAREALQNSTCEFKKTDSIKHYQKHFNLLPLLLGRKKWLDDKIKEALS